MIKRFFVVPAGKHNRRELLRGSNDGGALHGVEVSEVSGSCVARGDRQTWTGRAKPESRRSS